MKGKPMRMNYGWLSPLVISGTASVIFAQSAASHQYALIPPPQHVEWREGTHQVAEHIRVWAPADWAERVQPFLWLLGDLLRPDGRFDVAMTAEQTSAAITIRPAADRHGPEGYSMEIGEPGIAIEVSQAGGVFNALATLAQLMEQSPGREPSLPAGRIEDRPDVPLRAVHIDMTAQQYTAAYVQKLMRELARYKINAIVFEYTAMFPFRRHSAICLPEAFTEEDIRSILRTAAACGQEIIPFLPCLGHLEFVLHREPYAHLGKNHGQYMLCPCEAESLRLVRELIDDLVEQHGSLRYLLVGGDEVGPMDCPKCKSYAEKNGFSSLYVKHYRAVAEHCRQRGIVPLLWSDVLLLHPEALGNLPRNIALIEWDYRSTADLTEQAAQGAAMGHLDQLKPKYREYFGEGIGLADARQRGGLLAFGHLAGFKKLGFDAFSAPAARCSGDSFDLPRYRMHMENIALAMRKSALYQGRGSIITSWSFRLSPHEVCLPEYACAAYGWNRSSPAVETLLTMFFKQRYGIEEPPLAEAILSASAIVPPSTTSSPLPEDKNRRWVTSAPRQAEQIKHFIEKNPGQWSDSCRQQREQLQGLADLLARAKAQARQRREEFTFWELSLQHLIHRLRLVQPLLPLVQAVEFAQPLDRPQIDLYRRQIEDLTDSRNRLRHQWAELFGDIHTQHSLEAELYTRFDAEKEMIDLLMVKLSKLP